MTWLTEQTLLPADVWSLVLAALGAMCIGMSKAGLAGTSTLNEVDPVLRPGLRKVKL